MLWFDTYFFSFRFQISVGGGGWTHMGRACLDGYQVYTFSSCVSVCNILILLSNLGVFCFLCL